jgi:methionine-gamma-lyase
VEKVNYPGLKTHKGHEIAARQMKDFGGMLSFEVRDGKEAGMKLVNALQLITVAVSLGDAESLIEHPASMTHSPYTEEELEAANIAPGLIRFSVGLENPEDIIADLEQAFAKI